MMDATWLPHLLILRAQPPWFYLSASYSGHRQCTVWQARFELCVTAVFNPFPTSPSAVVRKNHGIPQTRFLHRLLPWSETTAAPDVRQSRVGEIKDADLA